MLRPKRILFALLTFVSAVIYVWVAAVRAVPERATAEGGCPPEQGRVDGWDGRAPPALSLRSTGR